MQKISVIVPTYSRSQFLKRAIQSILNQTYKNIEIIVVDDNISNSKERNETEKIMEEYKLETKIRYIKNIENLGGALSRNKGIEVAEGEYIAFLDDDDQYLPDKIEKQYCFYKEKFSNEEGFIYCQSKIVDENGKRIPNIKKYVSGNQEAIFEILKTGFTSTGCIFLPKKLLLEVGKFEKLICGQEWYLMLKILSKGYSCYPMEEELLIYYEHSGERITNSNKKIEGEKFLYEIKKKYIQELSLDKQRELNYFNNFELANLHFQFRKKGALIYLKKALASKMISFRDLLKLIMNILLNQSQKIYLKRILLK